MISPTCAYPASFELGDEGWPVWVLQINLNAWRDLEGLERLTEDGVCGPQTVRGVRTLQRRRSLLVDGIAGPRTQKRMALDLMKVVVQPGINRCVLRGFTELEAGYLVAAINCRGEGRAGKDCGWNQWRVYDDEASEQKYRDAFYGPSAFKRTAELLARRITELKTLDNAILAHNWYAAARRFADGTIKDWIYESRDLRYRMNDPAPWIQEKDIDGVMTGFDWADFYVARVKRYC